MDLLIKGIPGMNYTLVNLEEHHRSQPLITEIRRRWPHAVWKRLEGKKKYPVARISLPQGDFMVMRNGYNLSQYNYAILDVNQKKFYFRFTYKDACDLVEILGVPDNETPLLLGKKLDKFNRALLEKRFKGEI